MGLPTLLNLPTVALPGQTTKMALTEEFMFQNVAYRPTVYITGDITYKNMVQKDMSKFMKNKVKMEFSLVCGQKILDAQPEIYI